MGLSCWDRCCCLLCKREIATRFLQVCAFPVVDVCWRVPMIDGSLPVGTVVAVSHARHHVPVCAFPVVGVCWRAPMMDGSVPVGTVVAVSYSGVRQLSGPSMSAPFLVVMLNCADMLCFSLLAHMCVCACRGLFLFLRCCLQPTVYCCAVNSLLLIVFPQDVQGRTHTRTNTRVPAT